MTDRAAKAARQSDPYCNIQFRRWPVTEATGPYTGPTRTWHAADVQGPMSRARRVAEEKWAKLTAQVQP